MKQQFISFVFILLSSGSFAQNRDSIYTRQYVRDSFTKYGIDDVFITLADAEGILIDTMTVKKVQYGTNNAVYWQHKLTRKAQTVMVKAEHPDYETTVMKLEMKTPARLVSYEFPELLMKRKMKETTMDELKVTATRIQLTYKGDTIVVDAGAFKIPEGSMLDALVARVPGAELKDDGSIYMNGRKVDYLTLNGKDFFKGKNHIMLNNLPYYVVNSLKFYEKEMPQSKMIHAETGEKDYVMDVVLKPEYSIGLMGNAEAGYGTNQRWVTHLFGLRFTKYSRLAVFGGANNKNEFNQPNSRGGFRVDLPNGEKKIRMVGASYGVDDKDGRFNDELNAYVNWTDSKNDMRTSSETFLPNGNTFSRSRNISSSKDFGSDLQNNWELKKLGLRFYTAGNFNKHNGGALSQSATFNDDPSDFGSCIKILDSLFVTSVNPTLKGLTINKVLNESKHNQRGYSFTQQANYEKTLPWGDDLWIHLNGKYDNERRDDFSRYRLAYPSGAQADNNQDRYTPYHHHGYSYLAKGQYTLHLLGDWSFNGSYEYEQSYNNNESNLYRLDMLNTDLELGLLPSQVDYLQTIDAGNSYHSWDMTKTHEVNAGLRYNHNDARKSIYLTFNMPVAYKDESVRYWRSNQDYDKQQNNWYLTPNMVLRITNKSKRSLGLLNGLLVTYGSNVQTPSLISQLDIEDTTNPLAITLGNPDLKRSRSHSIRLNLSNNGKSTNFSLNLAANFNGNMVANGFTYNAKTGVYTYRPQNVNGNRNSSARLFSRTFLDKDKRFQLEGNTEFFYWHNVDLARVEGYDDSQLSRVNHYNAKQGGKVSYNKESLRLEAGGAFSWHVVDCQYNTASNINAYDFDYGISGQYTLPWKVELSTDLRMYSRRGYDEPAMNSNELIWNAQVSRSFFKEKLTVRLVGTDILRKKRNYSYTVNGQGRTERWEMWMPSYLMLRVAYKFNKEPKKQ